ncbi:hypothetical protein EYC80_005430 [Monilinia laxa]|nr:hypothetical protein EYC80_005430 [Monilinia laxa]
MVFNTTMGRRSFFGLNATSCYYFLGLYWIIGYSRFVTLNPKKCKLKGQLNWHAFCLYVLSDEDSYQISQISSSASADSLPHLCV